MSNGDIDNLNCPCPVPPMQEQEEVRFSYEGTFARLDRVEKIVQDFDDAILEAIRSKLLEASTILDSFDSETVCKIDSAQGKAVKILQQFDDFISGTLHYLLTEILRWCFESGIDMGEPSEIQEVKIPQIDVIDVRDEVHRLLGVVDYGDSEDLKIVESMPTAVNLPPIAGWRNGQIEPTLDRFRMPESVSIKDNVSICCPSSEAILERIEGSLSRVAEQLSVIAMALTDYTTTFIPKVYDSAAYAEAEKGAV